MVRSQMQTAKEYIHYVSAFKQVSVFEAKLELPESGSEVDGHYTRGDTFLVLRNEGRTRDDAYGRNAKSGCQ